MSIHLCLFEDDHVENLRPLVETRAAFDLRLGIRTILETTREALDALPVSSLGLLTRPIVGPLTAQSHEHATVNSLPETADVLFVNGRFVAEGGSTIDELCAYVSSDASPRTFTRDDAIVAAWAPSGSHTGLAASDAPPRSPTDLLDDAPTTAVPDATLLTRPWDLLDLLRPSIERDVDARTEAEPSRPISARPQASVHESVVAVHADHIYLGQDVDVRPGAILNAEDGPIYIGPEATIGEQAVLRGPCYVGPKTQIKIGANVDGAAFGYWCKVAGEVHDTVLHSLSNKAHPGFLGHSYLGRWCNLGADTNNSNLKNDYSDVSAYAPADDTFVSTGRQFAGLFMGDHSKCGINTMFNTGTVVGTCCNVFGGDFPPRYLPPFSWGSPARGFEPYHLDRALTVAEHVMGRRETEFTEAHRTLLETLFRRTQSEREVHLA